MVDQIRRDRRYRSLGWIGVLVSIALFVVARVLSAPHDGSKSLFESLPEVLPAILASASLLLIAWVRVWIRESNEPFKYTFSVGEFECVPAATPSVEAEDEDPMRWLTRDLIEKLSERVQRLSLLEADCVPEVKEGDPPASHVHISGWYGFREGDPWELEVVPKVRLGGKGAPAKLAKTVRFRLRSPSDPAAAQGQGQPASVPDEPPSLEAEDYRMLFERVYWSVASQIYAQIRHGVAEKVKLLPRGRLRAGAYIREADDYAASNTLDAYEAARKLYRQAREFYDISSRPEASSRLRQVLGGLMVKLDHLRHSFRRARSYVWRRSGRPEVMTARAELGYAQMLIAEWHLKLICGMVPNEMYAAGEIVDEAVFRLSKLSPDVSGQPDALFRAYVTQATARLFLRNYPGALDSLGEAKQLRPARAREDADFLFVSGLAEPNQLRSLRLLGRAVELSPMMERAHYFHATRYETIWRGRKTLEPDVANLIDAEYEEVIALNPGNLSAWANRGYVGWLLAEGDEPTAESWRQRATNALEAGRQYKEVRREATVGELDWNLTRLAAEKGDFTKAYEHYINAVSAKLMTPQLEFEHHFYEGANPALVERFERYATQVMTEAGAAETEGKTEKRLIESVKAFVYNDCGLLYQSHYERSGDDADLGRAERAFKDARRENLDFVLPTFNLAKLWLDMAPLPGNEVRGGSIKLVEDAVSLLERALRREPDWPQAQLLLIRARGELMVYLREELAHGVTSPAAHPSPVAGDGGDDSTASAERGALALEAKYLDLRGKVETELSCLLPHGYFTASQRGDKLDIDGKHVEDLVGDGSIQWTRDFDLLHVAALIEWARILAVCAAPQANPICKKLREVYYRADFELLDTHLRVARQLTEVDASEAPELTEVIAECQLLLGEVLEAVLAEDPVHLGVLQWTPMLVPPKRKSAIDAALERDPSPTTRELLMEELVELGDELVELEDAEGALEAFGRAARGSAAIAPAAKLRLAGLQERTGRPDAAVAAFREVFESEVGTEEAAEGAAGAARVLTATDKPEEAQAIYDAAMAKPAVAAGLASWLGFGEGKTDAAVEIFRGLLARAEVGEEIHASSHISLGLLLETSAREEAREHLRTASEMNVEPARWDAAIYLARSLAAEAPAVASALYEQTIATAGVNSVLVATQDLIGLLETSGDGGGAVSIRNGVAKAHPEIAAALEP